MENKGQVRKMKENQWKTQGKASQTGKQKKFPKKNKKNSPKKSKPFVFCLWLVVFMMDWWVSALLLLLPPLNWEPSASCCRAVC